MRIFDLEYLFYKNLRSVRRSYAQRRFRRNGGRHLTSTRLVRVGAFALLGVVMTGAVLTGPATPEEHVEEAPAVLSATASPEEVVEEEVRRIPDSPDAPQTSAQALYLIDGASGEALYARNETEARPVASITKVMTALIVLNNYALDERIATPTACTALAGNQVGLATGEEWTVEELLYAMLLLSASDATCTLASHYTSVPDFVAAMNLQAQALGLSATSFTNPIGLDEPGQASSAADVVRLGMHLMGNDDFRRIVATPEIEIQGRIVTNTNELLGILRGLQGIKTGTTDAAGECFLFFG